MKFMNSWDIQRALSRHKEHPVLGPATRTLANLELWTNQHSDGWAYWPAPVHAAKRLITLIDGDGTWEYLYGERNDATPEAYRKALTPIKAFRTKHRADFKIVELP